MRYPSRRFETGASRQRRLPGFSVLSAETPKTASARIARSITAAIGRCRLKEGAARGAVRTRPPDRSIRRPVDGAKMPGFSGSLCVQPEARHGSTPFCNNANPSVSPCRRQDLYSRYPYLPSSSVAGIPFLPENWEEVDSSERRERSLSGATTGTVTVSCKRKTIPRSQCADP